MQLLDRLLDRLHAKKHKVLIFSQMTKMLDLLDSYFEQKGHRACRIDGSIPWQERQKSINDFNSNDPSTWLFLLSTRAGGLGINLTAADTVIIYDRSALHHSHYVGHYVVMLFCCLTSIFFSPKVIGTPIRIFRRWIVATESAK